MNEEKACLSEIVSVVEAYELHKAKKGLTINIELINKKGGSTSSVRESFRDAGEAIAFIKNLTEKKK